ncbi:MAG: hypothetical protein HY074_10600 [Deltaproteobacteria bacterium]|nr:hypothetical protein [Deltaproteobacteria bacterium]
MKPFWDLIEQNLGADFAEDLDLQADVHSLSEGFTDGRGQLDLRYFEDPRFQAAYLAYFVPLNFEKAHMLLSSHSGVWPSELDVTKPQRWVDFGCGPGTAALAALAAYKNRYKKIKELPPVHLDLVDNQTSALNLAESLVTEFAKKLGLTVKISLHTTLPSESGQYDLALAANVLNELPPEEGTLARELLLQLWDSTRGVMLVLEPGHRVPSQRLVRYRERLLKTSPGEVKILGPCHHTAKCPVHRTKHWCHFSEPVTEGRLIDLNLRIFKDPRSWLKFSYLLVRRGAPVIWDEKTFRAIGDLHLSGPKRMAIDLCRPDEKLAITVPANIPPELRSTLVRGATVWLDEDRQVTARPLTKREIKYLPPKRERSERTDKPAHNPRSKKHSKRPSKR